MKQTIYSICMALCLCFIATSCEDSFDDLDKAYHPTGTELSDTALALNSIIDHIGGAGGKYSCTVKAGEGISWRITGAPSWVKFSQTTGKGSTKISYTVEQNPSTVTERTEHFYLESTQQHLPFKLTYKARQHARPTATAVDLGLSVKWASCNVGATTPEGFGGYYSWGEIEKEDGNYKWYNGSYRKIIKYNDKIYYSGPIDNKTQLDLEDDVAHIMWGGNWRMPTEAEWQELKEKCSWYYGYQNDIFGLTAIGPNGNSIFIPCAGYSNDSDILYMEEDAYYWSSTRDSGAYSANEAYYFYYYEYNNRLKIATQNRIFGCSVRPVTK